MDSKSSEIIFLVNYYFFYYFGIAGVLIELRRKKQKWLSFVNKFSCASKKYPGVRPKISQIAFNYIS